MAVPAQAQVFYATPRPHGTATAQVNGMPPVRWAAPCAAPQIMPVAQMRPAAPYAYAPAWGPSAPPGPSATQPVSGSSAGTVSKRQFMNPKSFQLMYKFNGDFKINGRPMYLTIDSPEKSNLATGLRIWDGGIVLAKYLEVHTPRLAQSVGRQLKGIELGCGTGVAGLGLAFLGHQALLTDIGEEQAVATQGNIAQNQPSLQAVNGSARYGHLDWRQLPERSAYGFFDLVLASDVIWHESLVEPFLQAVAWCASGPGCGEVLLSHKARDQESVNLFHQMLPALGLAVTAEVPSERVLGEHGHPDVRVYHLRRR